MAATDPAPREPRRFSIQVPRPFWIGLTTIGLVVAGVTLRIGLPIYRQRAAVREIWGVGGYLQTSPGGPQWLRERVGDEWMKSFDEVDQVHLRGEKVTDSTLGHVGRLTGLRLLYLGSNTRVTDAGLANLKELPRLRNLSLGMQVTDAGMAHLRGHTNLEELSFNSTQLTDAGLVHLKRLTNLKELGIANSR